MAKDPGFIFYPGDYLRDTQCLSEKAQVSYDRIMCEHMRNICEDMSKIVVSKERVDFFTKRLSEDERSELFHVLVESSEGYQIEWVALSCSKRKNYTNSRASNRSNKNKNHMNNICEHMEIENDNENTDLNNNVLNGSLPKKLLKYKDEPDSWRLDVSKFLKDQKFKQDFCIAKSIKLPDLEKRMADFVVDLNLKMDYKDHPGIKRHFINHYKKYVENGGVGVNGKSKGFIDVPKDLDYESQTL
jgi:hypothetical protein